MTSGHKIVLCTLGLCLVGVLREHVMPESFKLFMWFVMLVPLGLMAKYGGDWCIDGRKGGDDDDLTGREA